MRFWRTWWNRRARRATHRALLNVNRQLINRDADVVTLDSTLVARCMWVRGQ